MPTPIGVTVPHLHHARLTQPYPVSAQPESRTRFAQLLGQGWRDAIRKNPIPTCRCTRIGAMGATAGRATPGCASIACC